MSTWIAFLLSGGLAGFTTAKLVRGKDSAAPTVPPPGPPLSRRPCWANRFGRQVRNTPVGSLGNRQTIFLYGGIIPGEATIQVEGLGGQDWLALQSPASCHIPSGGSTEVILRPRDIDPILADLKVRKLEAVARATIGSGASQEFRLTLDLVRERKQAVARQPFVVSDSAPLMQDGKVELEVTNPHPFVIKLSKIRVYGGSMKLQRARPVGDMELQPGQSTTLPLRLTGSPTRWGQEIQAHFKARASYQGYRGVTKTQAFQLTVPPSMPGFDRHKDHGTIDAVVTKRSQGTPPVPVWEWEADMPLPVIPTGYRVEYSKLTIHYPGKMGGKQTLSCGWPLPGGAVNVHIRGHGLEAIIDGPS